MVRRYRAWPMSILAAGPHSEPEAEGATAAEAAGDPEPPEDLTWRRLSRLMSVCLLGLWTGLFLVILIAYRPGGRWDALVAAAAFAPVLIAAIAVVWPPMPVPRGVTSGGPARPSAGSASSHCCWSAPCSCWRYKILAAGGGPGTVAIAGGDLRAHPGHRVPECVRGPRRDARRPGAGLARSRAVGACLRHRGRHVRRGRAVDGRGCGGQRPGTPRTSPGTVPFWSDPDHGDAHRL